MHELLLYGQVPLPRHEQVLKILAGIAAMQPQALYERHLIYRPLRPMEEIKPNKKFPAAKPIKQPTATYHQLIKELAAHDFQNPSALLPGDTNGEDETVAQVTPWLLRTQEVPEPETKDLMLRQTTEVEMDRDALAKFLDPSNYGFVNEFVLEGHRLVHKNIVITLFRLLRSSEQPQPAPVTSMPALEALSPMDMSGAFVLEARVRIEDRTRASLVDAATRELFAFKDLLRGCVDLRVPERLSLDSRVR